MAVVMDKTFLFLGCHFPLWDPKNLLYMLVWVLKFLNTFSFYWWITLESSTFLLEAKRDATKATFYWLKDPFCANIISNCLNYNSLPLSYLNIAWIVLLLLARRKSGGGCEKRNMGGDWHRSRRSYISQFSAMAWYKFMLHALC